MRTRSKLILGALTASLLMGLAVSSATANRLSVSNTKFRITWTGLRFFPDTESGRPDIVCPVTLEGSFHSATIRKTAGALIGAVTRGIVNGAEPPCVGGHATIRQESLPWHVTYESFRGTLPNITSIELLLRRYSFVIELAALPGLQCLYSDQGAAEENLMGRLPVGAGGQVPTIAPEQNRHARRSPTSSVICPQFGKFEGTGQVFLLGSATTRISVTLI
jgi:hypothetical protein